MHNRLLTHSGPRALQSIGIAEKSYSVNPTRVGYARMVYQAPCMDMAYWQVLNIYDVCLNRPPAICLYLPRPIEIEFSRALCVIVSHSLEPCGG